MQIPFQPRKLKPACTRYNRAAEACGSDKRLTYRENDRGWPWSVTQMFNIDGAPSEKTWGFTSEHKAATFVIDAAVFMEMSVRRPAVATA